MREKIWEYRNKQLKKEDVADFSKKHSLPPALAVVLMNRGISDDDFESYMKKSLEGVHNPFLLNDMEQATERIQRAVNEKEKIVIYGDYDVDGVTATSVLYKFLKSLDADVDYYIPDRFSEGYGINIMAVNRLARAGVKLLISVDCGITAIGEAAFAKTQGMDVIITDHHTCREEIPKAVAVINPKRKDSTYPFDGLAGVGVAFKLVLALAVKLGMNTKQVFADYADLTALGTIADVVPLCGENRVIVSKGLDAIKNTKNYGICAILDAAGIKTPDSTSVAFFAAPRINVAGRMENAKIAVELLTCDDEARAVEIAEYLNSMNGKRQAIEKEIFDEALAQAESFEKEQSVYVLNRQGWHHGVIGIVASRICERFYRPCILISCENGKGKASGRSIEEVNLYDAISDSEELLTAFGGHSQAAGLSIGEDKIDLFREKINAYVKENTKDLKLIPKIRIDCNLNPAGITLRAAKMLSILEPFGEANENPIFSACGLKIMSVSQMGADGKHLRMRLTDGTGVFNAVGFGMGEAADELTVGEIINIAFNMNINVYQGNENLQLVLKDIKRQEGSVVNG